MVEAHAWNDRLDTGHAAMDREHHLQIALVTAFTEAVEQRRPWMARRLSEELAGYSEAHFMSEELLMEARAWPGLREHAEEHRRLLERIAELHKAFTEGEDDRALSLALDLRTALAGHMADSDRRLVEAMEGPGAR
jgi:hemerythrin